MPQGVFGGFTNKVGNVIGSSWKGISTLRIMPTSVANPRTQSQVNQRNAFSKCTAFASAILATICVPLWNRFAMRMSGYNAFVKANVQYFGLAGIADPSQIVMSQGKLEIGQDAGSAISVAGGNLSLEMTAVVNPRFGADTDKLYVVVYDNIYHEFSFAGDTGLTRADAEAGCSVPLDIVPTLGRTYLVYVSYLRADGTMVSNSYYMGIVATA